MSLVVCFCSETGEFVKRTLSREYLFLGSEMIWPPWMMYLQSQRKTKSGVDPESLFDAYVRLGKVNLSGRYKYEYESTLVEKTSFAAVILPLFTAVLATSNCNSSKCPFLNAAV